mgnify:CR=1 FL=1
MGKRMQVLVAIVLLVIPVIGVSAIDVGLVVTNMSAESQSRVANAFQDQAERRGWDVTLHNSQSSMQRQSDQVDNLVTARVDAIVMAMAHTSEIRPSLDRAIRAGIPIITIDSGYADGVVADITANNFVMGAKVSTYLVDSLGGEGDIVVLKFEKHFGTRRRGKVLDQVLSEYPGINVLAEYGVVASARYMEDTRSAMETYATRYGRRIDAVWCAFDQLAYAASDVLFERGITDAIITGVDGNEETFRRIEGGRMTATVAQPFEEMAATAVNLVRDIVVRGMDPDDAAPAKIIYVDAPLVDENNVDEHR